jgi:cytoskeletal protein RodZ
MPEETFGARLRRERERRQIALASIAENTKIRASLFEELERGNVSHWPSGIFRKAYIQAYAKAIGLDVEATAKEFLERHPDPGEVIPEPAQPPAPPKATVPRQKAPLVTITVRVPRGLTERLFTVVRPWSRA